MAAFLLVSEFAGLGNAQANEGAVPILAVPPIVEQQVTVSASGVVIAKPFQPQTQWVELCATSTCSVFFGPYASLTTASVTTGNGRMSANERVIRRVANNFPFTVYPGGQGQLQGFTSQGLVVIVAT